MLSTKISQKSGILELRIYPYKADFEDFRDKTTINFQYIYHIEFWLLENSTTLRALNDRFKKIDISQARTQGGCPGNHLFVLKYLIWLNENIILFDIFFIKGLVKGRLTNENNKRTIAHAEIFDNRNGPQVGYDQALYPRPHDIFDYLCFLS